MYLGLRLIRNYEADGIKRWTVEIDGVRFSFKPDAEIFLKELVRELQQRGVTVAIHPSVDNTRLTLKQHV